MRAFMEAGDVEYAQVNAALDIDMMSTPTDYFYGWLDFEPDTVDNIPDKYTLTIGAWERDEFSGEYSFMDETAVIVHRTDNDRFPLDGAIADRKRQNAQIIVDGLNAIHGCVPVVQS